MNKYFIKAAVFNIFLAICGCWPIYYVPSDHIKQNERILFYLFFRALNVIKSWNEDVSPNFGVTDYCSEEIKSIETVFPGITFVVNISLLITLSLVLLHFIQIQFSYTYFD